MDRVGGVAFDSVRRNFNAFGMFSSWLMDACDWQKFLGFIGRWARLLIWLWEFVKGFRGDEVF